jgi:hypothetical protein
MADNIIKSKIICFVLPGITPILSTMKKKEFVLSKQLLRSGTSIGVTLQRI